MKERLMNFFKEKKKGKFDSICKALRVKNKSDVRFVSKILDELIFEDKIIMVGGYFGLPDQFETYEGVIEIKRDGYGFVIVEGLANDIFVPAAYTMEAHDGDRVLVGVMRTRSKSGCSNEGMVCRILDRGIKRIVGTFDGKFIKDDNKKNVYPIKVNKKQTNGAVVGHKVVASITSYHDGYLTARIDRIIGHVNDPHVDIMSIVASHDLPTGFSDEIMKEVKEIPDVVLKEQTEGREDLRELLTITIDGDDAKDLDDAISLQKSGSNYVLYVHIADVSYYVTEGSLLDQETYYRGTSVYLADTVIPMLPHYLSNGICSLNSNVDRLAMTCKMEISEKGNVVSSSIFPSVINSNYRMTYKNVNKMLDGENIYPDIRHMVFDMRYLAKILKEKRILDGSIEFNTMETKIICDDTGKAIDVKPYDRGISEGIIEEFMLIANQTVAKTIKNMNLPFLYRVHENPDESKMAAMLNIVKSLGIKPRKKAELITQFDIQRMIKQVDEERKFVINSIMLRSMMKARYCREPLGHYGLAFVDYTHFTSPIRRYPDLIVHRLLRKYLFLYERNKTYYGVLESIALQTSKSERRAVECERDVIKMKQAEYMKEHIGEEYDCLVSGITHYGLYVMLNNTVEGLVSLETIKGKFEFNEETMQLIGYNNGRSFRIGDKLRVIAVRASKELREIDFEIKE